jgi:hypothetical protein
MTKSRYDWSVVETIFTLQFSEPASAAVAAFQATRPIPHRPHP